MRLLAPAMLYLFLGMTAPDARGGDTKKDQDKMQGAWQVVEFIADGKTIPEDIRSKLVVVIKDDRIELTGFGGVDKRELAFKLDPTKKPKAMDVTPQDGPYKGKTNPAIYDFDGDSLKLCMSNRPTTERPTEFKAEAGSNLGLLVLRRAKS